MRLATIRSLLSLCSPANISRLVISVVVDAVNGMGGRWPAPHICEEILESVPSPADLNAPRSVIRIVPDVRIIAAASHGHPDSVFRSNLSNFLGSVTQVCKAFTLQASTALAFSSAQIICMRKRPLAAFASAIPTRLVILVIRTTPQCPKSPEPLASQIVSPHSCIICH